MIVNGHLVTLLREYFPGERLGQSLRRIKIVAWLLPPGKPVVRSEATAGPEERVAVTVRTRRNPGAFLAKVAGCVRRALRMACEPGLIGALPTWAWAWARRILEADRAGTVVQRLPAHQAVS